MKEFLLVFGMMIVTFGVRYPVLALFGRIEFPRPVSRALRFVPVAVLSALAAPMVFISDGQWFLSFENAALAGSFVALLVALKTGHLLKTIVFGMLTFVAVRSLLLW